MKNLKTAAIILAAGTSKRMGEPKQLINWQGKTFLNHVIYKVSQCELSPIIIVLGAYRDKIIQTIIQNPQIKIIQNNKWTQGISTSVKIGIKNLPNNIDNVIIFLADQPQVRMDTIESLIKKASNSSADVIVPIKNNKKGNPILIKSNLFKEIDQLIGDQGFKQILNNFSQDFIESKDDSIFFDVDFLEDLDELEKYNNAK